MRDNYIEHWQTDWQRGEKYDLLWKRFEVLPALEQLKKDGHLGPVVADVGSGPLGVSSLLYDEYPDLKLIRVDIAAKDVQDDKAIQVQMDVDKLSSPELNTKKSLIKIRRWLEDQGIHAKSGPVVDTMILTDLINYIDYQNTLPALMDYVKEGGRVVVFNMPTRGRREDFIEKDKRASGNIELSIFLEKLGLRPETLTFNNNKFFGKTISTKSLAEFDQAMMLYIGRLESAESKQ